MNSATRTVRGQGTKVEQLRADHAAAHHKSNELAAKLKELELELKSRDARIELLRERQQNATVPKEYQALIVEINTYKLDKSKLEEQALALMEQAETSKKNESEVKGHLGTEDGKLGKMTGDIDARVKELSAEVARLKGPREELAATIPHAAIAVYHRAAERYDGEAMAPIEKPDVRDVEYLCAGCNTYLVANIYNRLMSSKDEIVLCPSCSRVLYVPEELTPELALSKKAARGDAKKPVVKGEKKPRAPRAKKEKSVIAAGKNAEPGSLAAAAAAGALAATGKGRKAKETSAAAPLPSRADGTANVSEHADAPDAPAMKMTSNDPEVAEPEAIEPEATEPETIEPEGDAPSAEETSDRPQADATPATHK